MLNVAEMQHYLNKMAIWHYAVSSYLWLDYLGVVN